LSKPGTIRNYYSAFKKLSALPALLISALPLLPEGFAPRGTCLFPPVGGAEGLARIAALIFTLSMTYFCWFWSHFRHRDNAKRVVVAMICAFVSLCAYFVSYQRFVRTIEIPSKETSVCVTVGYDRTDFARTTFDSESDWQILRDRGVDDEEISRLWTARSLTVARLLLFVSYCCVLFSLVAAVSWGLMHQMEKT
jgi:hypothetical protein